jgi:MFS superfamily sulfate permease-like transporter
MTTTTAQKKPGRKLPILAGIWPVDRSRVPTDIIAGTTLAALAIPEVMGYTKIAGMPVITCMRSLAHRGTW